MFLASASEKALVVADLAQFRRSGSIPLDAAPDQVVTTAGKLYAVCGAKQGIVRIDPMTRSVTGKIALGANALHSVLSADGKYILVATAQPSALVLVDTNTDKIVHKTSLPGNPVAIAVANDQAAVLLDGGRIARLSIPACALLGVSSIGATNARALGYRKDGETIFVAATDARQIISLSASSGAVLAKLPIPIRPARFCVDGTGGQVFVTGADRDPQLVIFSPYQNQIDQTIYAGHALYGMAVAPVRGYLFLSNPDAGDVTILEIETRRILASIRTGGNPREILISSSANATAQEEYAFAVDGETGDVSVIHIPVVLHKSGDAFIAEPPKPVFAVFHGGAQPQSAVIVRYAS
jgi:DNA-binding beta-propeller fold protein YncE